MQNVTKVKNCSLDQKEQYKISATDEISLCYKKNFKLRKSIYDFKSNKFLFYQRQTCWSQSTMQKISQNNFECLESSHTKNRKTRTRVRVVSTNTKINADWFCLENSDLFFLILNRSPNFLFNPNLDAAFNSPPILSGKSPWEDSSQLFLHILPRSVDSLRFPSSRCEIFKDLLVSIDFGWLVKQAVLRNKGQALQPRVRV